MTRGDAHTNNEQYNTVVTTTRVAWPWIVKLICHLCYTGDTKSITSIMVYRKYLSFNTINFTSFNNVYTSVVNKYRTIYWVLMTIPRALDFVYFIGGGVIIRKYYPWIRVGVCRKCDVSCTLKTTFIDPGKVEANCVPYNMLHFSPVPNSSGCEVVQSLPHSILMHVKFAAGR